MVAVVTGNGLGLVKSSANILGAQGQIGAAGLGRGGESVFVNAANGNLVISRQDEVLTGRGPDSAVNRTYNSQGQLTDENGDNWANFGSRVVDFVGGWFAAGSYLDRLDWDGGRSRYYFDTTKGVYVSKEGGGAFDSITYTNGSWTWTDGDSGIVETYGAAQNNRVVSRRDRDGNTISYAYTNDKISQITTADGNYTTLVWSGNNLQRLVTVYTDPQGQGRQLTRTHYSYDGENRLTAVTVDLSPSGDSIADGHSYTTNYTYAGPGSRLITSITQTDGSRVDIAYDGAGRVSTITQIVEGGNRTTTFGYGGGYTNITDAQGNLTQMYFDGTGLLTTLVEPAAAAGGNPRITDYGYDGHGNVTTIFTYEGWANRSGGNAYARDWYRYDGNGNVYDRYQWVDGGYLVTRYIYGAQNQLLTETRYTALDFDGHGAVEPTGAMTTRYVYDGELHLRFRITGEGRVTEYRYDAAGNAVAEIAYTVNTVGVAGLPETFNWVEQDFINWLASIGDKSNTTRIDRAYDFRGNLSVETRYVRTLSNGEGDGAAGYTQTLFVYDQQGNLLRRQTAGVADAESYAYDGLGRVIRHTDSAATGTWTSYLDKEARTVVTLANGLTQTSAYNKAGELIGFVEARGGVPVDVAGSRALANWGASNVSLTSAGEIDGVAATRYTVQTGGAWSAIAMGFNVSAGETMTLSLSMQAVAGSSTTQYVGLYSNNSGWGASNISSVRIVSGPGTATISPWLGGLWKISGLSTTEATRIEIVRTYTQTESGGAYIYADLDGGHRAGQSLILAAPSLVKSRYNDTASVASFDNGQLDINNWGYGGATREAAGSLHGAVASKYTVQATGQWTGVATGFNAEAGDTITASVSLMAVGSGNSASFGIYGNATDWNYQQNSVSSARIISGPGTLTQEGGGLWNITGLSASEATRIEITRTFAAGESGGVYLYPERPNGWIAGRAIIAGAASVVKTPGDLTGYRYDTLGQLRIKIDPAGKRTHFFYDKEGKKIADVAADGAVTEYRYDAAGRTVASVQYATLLNASQLASLIDGAGNPTAVEFAALRPGATGSDRWAWTVYDRAGRVIETIDAIGATTEFVYDAAGRIKYQWKRYYTLSQGQLDSFKATPPASRVVPADYAGVDRITQFYYDNQNLLIGQMDEEGYLTQHFYDGALRKIYSTRYNNLPNLANRLTDSFQTLLASAGTHPNDSQSHWVYDGRGLVAATIDGEGNLTRFAYNGRGEVIREERGQKVAANTHYTLATLPGSSGATQVTLFNRDTRGRVTSQTQQVSSGSITASIAYDAVGNAVSATDGRGHTAVRTYDARGRLVRLETPLDNGGAYALTRYEYDSRGNLVRTIDPRGNATYNYYDDRSRLVLQIDGEGYATETSYNVFGDMVSVRRYYQRASGIGNVNARPALSGHAKDAVTTFNRDNLGRLTGKVDAEGYGETYYLDAFGQTYYMVNKLGAGTSYAYTRRGQLYYEYNNQLVVRSDGSTQANNAYKILNVYDARGNLIQSVEGYGLSERRDTYYSYDRNNRLIRKDLPAVHVFDAPSGADILTTPSEHYTYDSRGNLIQMTDAAGGRTLYYYDEANRKIAEINAVGTHRTFAYDGNGNLAVERTYGSPTALPGTPGGAPPSPSGAPREVYYTYDRANRLIEKRIPGVTSLSLSGTTLYRTGADLVTALAYDAMGNVVRETDARGSTVHHYYDRNGREIAKVDQENYLTTWVRDSEGNALEDRRFANAVGTQFGFAASIGSSVTDLVNSAGYNGLDRITVFEYDRMGRRTLEGRYNVNASQVSGNAIVGGAAHAYITYTYNGFGEVTSKTEATGDRTDYVYDGYGRLTRKIDPYLVNYAGSGARLATDLYYDGLNNLVYERQSEYYSGADARATRYTYAAGGRLKTVVDGAGNQHYYQYNIKGEVRRDEVLTQRSNGNAVHFTKFKDYDAVGRLVSELNATYEGGSGWQYGTTLTTAFDAYGDAVSRSVSGTVVEQMAYDNAGRLVKSSAGDGVWKFFGHDANGNTVLTMTSTNITDLGHWGQGDALWHVMQNGGLDVASLGQYYVTATVANYDRRNMATETFEPNRTIANAGDVAQNTTQTLTTRRWYNAFGEVSQERSARGHFTNYAYNTMGRLIQLQAPETTVTLESGAAIRQRPTENYAYDVSGRLIGTQNANGFWTTRTLLAGTGYGEGEALATAEYRPDGSVWHTGYDVFTNVRKLTDGIGRVSWQEYDAANRLVKVTRASGLVEQYAYDGLGQRIKKWNNVFQSPIYGTPVWVESGYWHWYNPYEPEWIDTSHWETPIIGYSPTIETTDYDGMGRVISMRNFAGDLTSYSYAWNGGHVTSGLGQFGGWTKTTSRQDGRSSSETTDIFGRTIGRSDLGGRVYYFTYNEAGQLAAQSSSAGQSLSYTYYNTGRLATMLDNAGTIYGYSTSNIDATYTYDAEGNRTYERLAGTYTWYDWYYGYSGTYTTVHQEGRGAYDEMGRLISFTDAGASGNGAVSITNAYDAAGNVRRTVATHATINANQTLGASVTDDYWYKYDALNRMTTVKGQLVSGAIVRGAGEGRDITYNLAGERATVARTYIAYGGYGITTAYETREVYEYNADGLLTAMRIATGSAVSGVDTPPPASGPGTLRAQTSYDLLGRVTDYREFDAAGSTVVFNRYGIYYDNRNAVLAETTTLRRTESDGYLYVTYGSVSNAYDATGVLTSSSSVNYRYRNGTQYQDTPDTSTSYTYQWWDGPQQATITFRPNTSQSTTYTSTYNYSLNGHLTSVYVGDGRPRNITYVTDAQGQILSRTEADNVAYNASTQKGGDPKQINWFFDGKQIGTTGNNGNDDPEFETALTERTATPAAGTPGAFRNGSHYATGYSDFDQAYNGLSPGEGGGPGSTYIVRTGDTLSSIAQSVLGDSALWYMIADANGLAGSGSLIAGQAITIPSKLANVHNTSDTFRPYDANRAIGDTQPTTPAPAKAKKGKCGVFGQIFLAVIAAAVTALTAGSLGPVAAAVLGSVASQAVGVATGIQEKFSFKAVAMAAIGAGIGAGIGELAKVGGAVGKVAQFLNAGGLGSTIAKGLVTNALTQGVAVATGLQKKFDWAGVAAAGVAAGVGHVVADALTNGKGLNSLTNQYGEGGELIQVGDLTIGNILAHGVTGMARAIASSATRSLVEGSNFGDNVLSSLPDAIGTTIGEAIGGALTAPEEIDEGPFIQWPAPLAGALPEDSAGQTGFILTQLGGAATMPRGAAIDVRSLTRGRIRIGNLVYTAAGVLELLQDVAERTQINAALERYNLDGSNATNVLAAASYVWSSYHMPLIHLNSDIGTSGPTNRAASEAILQVTLVAPELFVNALRGHSGSQMVLSSVALGATANVVENRARPSGVAPELQTYSSRYRRAIASSLRSGNMQVHHLIPAEVWGAFEQTSLLARQAGWRQDGAENLIALPADEATFRSFGGILPIHRGSHPNYNAAVLARMTTMIGAYGGRPTAHQAAGIYRLVQAQYRLQIMSQRWHQRVN